MIYRRTDDSSGQFFKIGTEALPKRSAVIGFLTASGEFHPTSPDSPEVDLAVLDEAAAALVTWRRSDLENVRDLINRLYSELGGVKRTCWGRRNMPIGMGRPDVEGIRTADRVLDELREVSLSDLRKVAHAAPWVLFAALAWSSEPAEAAFRTARPDIIEDPQMSAHL